MVCCCYILLLLLQVLGFKWFNICQRVFLVRFTIWLFPTLFSSSKWPVSELCYNSFGKLKLPWGFNQWCTSWTINGPGICTIEWFNELFFLWILFIALLTSRINKDWMVSIEPSNISRFGVHKLFIAKLCSNPVFVGGV